jgi:hypothetical protein
MATLTEIEEAERRALAIAEARRICAGHEAKLAKSRERLAELQDADFVARLASNPVSQMTTTERSELIQKRGLRFFQDAIEGVRAMNLGDFRAGLAAQREVLAAQLEAIADVESGLARLEALGVAICQETADRPNIDKTAKRKANGATETRPCAGPGCSEMVEARYNRQYCSEACKHRAWSARQKAAPEPVDHAEPGAAAGEVPTEIVAQPNGASEAAAVSFGQA